MKKLSQKLWTICLILLILCAGVYILFLRDRCNILKDKLHVQSLQITGYRYKGILEWFKTEKGEYPPSLEELVPNPLLSIYDLRLGYGDDPYYWEAIRKYRKENNEWPASLEVLVPKYLSDLSSVNWEYTCDPNGLSYNLCIVSETSLYQYTISASPEGVLCYGLTLP